jgi:Flp pilus assembly protein TadB
MYNGDFLVHASYIQTCYFVVQVFSGVVLSMSQVYGISHAPTAILMYLAVLIYSPIMAAFAVLGATLGTLTGRISTMPFSILVIVSSFLRVSMCV